MSVNSIGSTSFYDYSYQSSYLSASSDGSIGQNTAAPSPGTAETYSPSGDAGLYTQFGTYSQLINGTAPPGLTSSATQVPAPDELELENESNVASELFGSSEATLMAPAPTSLYITNLYQQASMQANQILQNDLSPGQLVDTSV